MHVTSPILSGPLNDAPVGRDARPETVFCTLLRGLGVTRLLDIGANDGQFVQTMRHLGYSGLVYSVEPQAGCCRKMTRTGLGDLRWIVLPSQGAGAEDAVLTFKVSENSVSSSFYAPHDNHLRAEPTVRTAREETVHVTRTSSLLPPAITRRVEALKIDTQGYELNVLKGLGDGFGALKLVLAELSAIPCYVGAPGLEEVDGYLTGTLGFVRVSLLPAYVEEANGEIQQYDGIYVRRDLLEEAQRLLAAPGPVAAGPAGNTGIALSAIALSLTHRPPKRPDARNRDFGPSWLESCHKSWMAHAPRVISLSEAPPTLPGIKWRKLPPKPPIRDMLASLAEAPPGGEGPVLLTNGDILFTPRLAELLPLTDPDVLYYCSRIDVQVRDSDPRILDPAGVYGFGFDAFLLPQDLIARIHRLRLFPSEFRIGEPWWDYALPIAALLAGHPVKKFLSNPHPVVHLKHETVSHAYFVRNGLIFRAWLRRLCEGPPTAVTGLLAEFLAAHDSSAGDEVRKLKVLARSVVAGLP